MLHKARRESLESKLQGKSREPETKAPGLIFFTLYQHKDTK